MPENPNIIPQFREIFIKAMRTHNKGLRYCKCGAKPKVTKLNFSTVEIECCNHLGSMELSRKGAEKYENFCLRAIMAWNYGEYEHTNSSFY